MEFIDLFGKIKIKSTERGIKKRLSAYGIAIKDNKVLLIKSKFSHLLELPGGGLEDGEDILVGLKREFLEETGHVADEINPECLKSLRQNFYANDLDEYFDSEMKFFIIDKLKKDETSKIDDYEVEEVVWIPISELNEKNCKHLHLELIKNLTKT